MAKNCTDPNTGTMTLAPEPKWAGDHGRKKKQKKT
jgi:hypothetical protein